MALPFKVDGYQNLDVGGEIQPIHHTRIKKCFKAMDRAQRVKLWDIYKQDHPATVTATSRVSVETHFIEWIAELDQKLCAMCNVPYGINYIPAPIGSEAEPTVDEETLSEEEKQLRATDKPTEIGKPEDLSWKLEKRDPSSMKSVALYQLPWIGAPIQDGQRLTDAAYAKFLWFFGYKWVKA